MCYILLMSISVQNDTNVLNYGAFPAALGMKISTIFQGNMPQTPLELACAKATHLAKMILPW